jgi:DNA-binding NtrC family response regulator
MELLLAHAWPGNIRELRNLVESMVVLSPGRIIRPEDIPDDVRGGRGMSLLPVPMATGQGETGRAALRPELEFVFRTLVELRVDMDDLRREFEAYRRGASVDVGLHAIVGRVGSGEVTHGGVEVGAYPSLGFDEEEAYPPLARAAEEDDGRVIVFRPGMTMEDMERRAIRAALAEVRGNRRKAADQLGIGERTLYRKIAKYGLDA